MRWWNKFWGIQRRRNTELYPDEVFLDSKNLPNFDMSQFQGRLEKPISRYSYILLIATLSIAGIVFVGKVWNLQIEQGSAFAAQSEQNRLHYSLIFAERGVIYDRNGVPLAYNATHPDGAGFAKREYIDVSGLSHILGYVKYPQKDSYGNYYETQYRGVSGIEKQYDNTLAGSNGLKIIETDALGDVSSESSIKSPQSGRSVYVSIDSEVQHALYSFIKEVADERGFSGGSGVLMDVHTGEVLALTNYPEYSSQILTDGKDSKTLSSYFNDSNHPLLNRAVSGLYTPGSIVKPFISLAALAEHVIDPLTKILSTGSISLPNPYDPTKSSVFTDWRAQGWVDMRDALAVSSDVYFYEIGGGFKDQIGLGIAKINEYLDSFGFNTKTGIDLPFEATGVVPNPEWKEKNFADGTWRIGDTYFTSIGQYGFQVTPVQAAQATAFIANGGALLTPSMIKDKIRGVPKYPLADKEYFTVVQEGMRRAVTEGTAKNLLEAPVEVAAKTGTAELGVKKDYVNSWITGFFPYDNPKYSFAVMMEHGPVHNTVGGLYVMSLLLDWMNIHTPQYL